MGRAWLEANKGRCGGETLKLLDEQDRITIPEPFEKLHRTPEISVIYGSWYSSTSIQEETKLSLESRSRLSISDIITTTRLGVI